MNSKTPVYLLTGFLGSGKTTLINELLKGAPKGKKVAVVVNEFGKVSIDGPIIKEAGYEVAELASGCICCSLKDDMARTLLSLREKRSPDLILVEPTGLAQPEELAEVIREQKVFEIRAIYGLVSVPSYFEISAKLPIINAQLKAAHFLMLTKCDLTTLEQRESVSSALKSEVSLAPQYFATQGEVDGPLLFPELYGMDATSQPTKAPGEHHGHHHHGHHHQNEFVSLVLPIKQEVKRSTVEALLEKHRSSVVRAKGMVRTENGMELFQWTLDGSSWVPWRDTADANLVVIVSKEAAADLMLAAL